MNLALTRGEEVQDPEILADIICEWPLLRTDNDVRKKIRVLGPLSPCPHVGYKSSVVSSRKLSYLGQLLPLIFRARVLNGCP